LSARRTRTDIFLESLPQFRPQTNQISESAAPQLTRSFRSWGASGRASSCPDPVVRAMFAVGSVLRPQTVGLGGCSVVGGPESHRLQWRSAFRGRLNLGDGEHVRVPIEGALRAA
jgi:hypothetical protein